MEKLIKGLPFLWHLSEIFDLSASSYVSTLNRIKERDVKSSIEGDFTAIVYDYKKVFDKEVESVEIYTNDKTDKTLA